MTRIQIACYVLIASAFVLTGLLIARVTDHVAPLTEPAYADQVSNKAGFTMVTARTRASGEESLFIIDDVSNLVMIYRVEPRGARGGRTELLYARDLTEIFRD